MPTDPNNVKDGQIVAVKMRVAGSLFDGDDHVSLEDSTGCQNVFRRTDIITDYPPQPSADGEWDNMVFQRMWNGEVIISAREDGYEYRVQRRPLKPAWKPEVGRAADAYGRLILVLAFDDQWAWVKQGDGVRWSVKTSDLTQPPEDATQ